MTKSCFFIGHQDAEQSLMPIIKSVVEKHIVEYGVTNFVVGQYGAFDRMAARAVIDTKKRFPGITLSVLLPYHPAERAVQAPEGYDGTFYPPGMEKVPRRFAIIGANQYMINHCDCLIAYSWKTGSNTQKMLRHAKSKKTIFITEIQENVHFVSC